MVNIIAELGINHNGNLDLAINMTDRAIDAGAEIIKHQTHVIDDEMSHLAKKVIPGNTSESIYQIMARCALSINAAMISVSLHAATVWCAWLMVSSLTVCLDRLAGP